MSDALERLQKFHEQRVANLKAIDEEEKAAQDHEAKAREHRLNRSKLKDQNAVIQKAIEDEKVRIHVENEATLATKARQEADKDRAEAANLKLEFEKKLAELEAKQAEQPTE